MTTIKEIVNLTKQLYPTGRAWDFARSNQGGDINDISIFTDSFGDPFTDSFGNIFVNISDVLASDGNKIINAELKSFIRLYDYIFSLLDITIPDNENFSETDASNWERVFGLFNTGLTLEDRKTSILRKMTYPNGVPDRAHYLFIQEQLQAAGFPVYITENRFPDGAGGWNVEDFDSLTSELYQLGIGEMGEAELNGEFTTLDYTVCANYIDETRDQEWLNQTFTSNELGEAEMGVSEMDSTPLPREQQLRYIFYVGGSSFPSPVNIPEARKDEFRQLVLKLKHLHTVAILFINYT